MASRSTRLGRQLHQQVFATSLYRSGSRAVPEILPVTTAKAVVAGSTRISARSVSCVLELTRLVLHKSLDTKLHILRGRRRSPGTQASAGDSADCLYIMMTLSLLKWVQTDVGSSRSGSQSEKSLRTTDISWERYNFRSVTRRWQSIVRPRACG
jgi:hypothetical protein